MLSGRLWLVCLLSISLSGHFALTLLWEPCLTLTKLTPYLTPKASPIGTSIPQGLAQKEHVTQAGPVRPKPKTSARTTGKFFAC